MDILLWKRNLYSVLFEFLIDAKPELCRSGQSVIEGGYPEPNPKNQRTVAEIHKIYPWIRSI